MENWSVCICVHTCTHGAIGETGGRRNLKYMFLGECGSGRNWKEGETDQYTDSFVLLQGMVKLPEETTESDAKTLK